MRTMKEKLWFSLVTCLVYCLDKELYMAITNANHCPRYMDW